MREVVFVTRLLTHYRVPFHEKVRAGLAAHGVHYRLLHSDARGAAAAGPASCNWAERVPDLLLGPFVFQAVVGRTRRADLVIIGQENALLANYVLMARRRLGGPSLAFFGHGRNWQSRRPDGMAERFKRAWIGEADWWFAYTDRCAAHVRDAGYPSERITSFNNAVDTEAIRAELAGIGKTETEAFRAARFGGSRHIAVQVGTLHAERRPAFLIDAADRVRRAVADFQLVIVGDGPERARMLDAAASRPFLHVEGPLHGRAKSLALSAAAVNVLPGLVGLGVLDGFAHGLPALATRYPFHSPEIDYLRDGHNGVLTPDAVEPFAAALVHLLTDNAGCRAMAAHAVETAAHYTVTAMADRFIAGTLAALAAKRQQRTKTVTVG